MCNKTIEYTDRNENKVVDKLSCEEKVKQMTGTKNPIESDFYRTLIDVMYYHYCHYCDSMDDKVKDFSMKEIIEKRKLYFYRDPRLQGKLVVVSRSEEPITEDEALFIIENEKELGFQKEDIVFIPDPNY